jgi:anti-sigma factor RsiW
MKVVPLDADVHATTRALLPWYAMNSLDEGEAAQVQAHLDACPSCRAELELERRLQVAQPLSVASSDVDRGWAGMRKLIRSDAQSRRRGVAAPWLRLALGLQFAVIAALGVGLAMSRAGIDAYRALGAGGAPVSANAVVMFKPDASEQEIRSALRIGGARLVDGPTASNAYLLSVPVDDHVAAIAKLRAQPAVSLAESLDARPAP